MPLLAVDVATCFMLKIMPLSDNIIQYIIVLLLAVFRILVSAKNYTDIQADSIKSGMILSAESSIVLSVKVPKANISLSTEKLDSRLNDEQVRQIVEWGRKEKATISIVRRIPFASFVFLGFIVYLIWGGMSL